MALAPALALLALALATSPAEALQLGPEQPHSPNAESIETTYWVMLAVTILALLAVNAALIAAVVRFRERRGGEPRRLAAGRGALRPITAVLGALALAIFIFGVVMTSDVREVEPTGPEGLEGNPTAQVGVKGLPSTAALGEEPSVTGEPAEQAAGAPLVIDAIAQQWMWRFEYPDQDAITRTFSYGELVVPVDTTVLLNIDSTDVNHSWWVPALGGQVQATPGNIAQTWFKADEIGRYAGRSTVFSGSAFPAMRSWVRVVSVPDYEAYIADLREQISTAQGIVQETAGGETP